jgi:3-methyl-2-oxobutanoate hydroxymethyltransferase
MSVTQAIKRKSVRDIRKGGDPIVFLTAYTAPMARFLDPHVDVLLVGDSLGMVLYGLDSTLAVTLEMMIAHGAAVMRGSQRACVIVDLPFGSYQESPAQAFRNAARVLAETGCAAVKLEGGAELAETIRFLTSRGIPVCGHIGLLPQSVNAAGGYRTHGREAAEAARIAADARAVADAGAFAMVIEGTLEPLARAITEDIAVPTIGIGASPACDGQVLVSEDILGLFADFTPRFVRRYADLGPEISAAAAAYAADVRARRFPGPEHTVGAAPKAKHVTADGDGGAGPGRRASGA